MFDLQRHRVQSRSGLYLKDDVPFSCCDPSVLRPCVHREMRDQIRHAKYPVGNSTLYKTGCSVAVHRHAAWVGSWLLSGLTTLAGLTVVILVLCRYVQTSVSEALRAGDVSLPSRGYLLSFGRRNVPGTRAPPPSPATQPSSPLPARTRGDKVVKTDAKQRRRRRRNINKSNRHANNSSALSDLVDDLLDDDDASQWSVNTDLQLIADQLAPSSVSDWTRTTSGQPSDDGTTSELPRTMLPANDSGTASRELSPVHASDSRSLTVGSSCLSSSSSQDNWNSNANVNYTRSVVPSLIERDRSQDKLAISRRRARSRSSASRQKRKYHEQTKGRQWSTSRSDRRNVTGMRAPPPTPVTQASSPQSHAEVAKTDSKRSTYRSHTQDRTQVPGGEGPRIAYTAAENSAETRKRKRSRSEDISVDWSSACGVSSVQRVKPSDRTNTHRDKDHRQIVEQCDAHSSKSLSEGHSTCEPVAISLDYLTETSRKKTLPHSSPTAEPRNLTLRKASGTCPIIRSLGTPETHSTGDQSSEWSTVSCRTIGDDTLSGSERSASRTRGVPDNNMAALLSLSNYLQTHNGDVLMATERYESRRCRSKKSSKVLQKSSSSAAYLALPDGRMCQTKKTTSSSKGGRLSNNSWSTVSCQPFSRPPSPKFRREIIVEEERACFSAGRTTSEQMRQTNNSCNSVLDHRSSFDVVPLPVMRRRPSNYFRHWDRDRIGNSSATIPRRTVGLGQISCDSRSMAVTRRASTKPMCRKKYKKASTMSTYPLPSPSVHEVIRALDVIGLSVSRQSSENFQHSYDDEISNPSATRTWNVGEESCASRSTTVTRSASTTKQLSQKSYKKTCITSTRPVPSPSVNEVVRALQMHLDASAPNTTSDHISGTPSSSSSFRRSGLIGRT